MQILGYRPYHMYECCAIGGVPHMKTFKEGIIAEFDRLSGGKRYTRADFDKWLGDYDVSYHYVLNICARISIRVLSTMEIVPG